MTGLGTMFTGDTAKVRIARAVLTAALRRLLRRPRSAVLVQNVDDRAMIERLGVDADRIELIPGSGVDVDRMTPSPEPAGAGHRRIRRPAGGIEGDTHARRGARAALPARPRHPAADRGPARPRQPGIDLAGRDRSLDQAAQRDASRFRRGHRRAVGVRAHRGTAVPSRGTAVEPAGGGRLRTAADCDRRAGLPGDRASRTSMPCWCRSTTPRRSPTRSIASPLIPSFGSGSAGPAASWSNANSPASVSAATWSALYRRLLDAGSVIGVHCECRHARVKKAASASGPA